MSLLAMMLNVVFSLDNGNEQLRGAAARSRTQNEKQHLRSGRTERWSDSLETCGCQTLIVDSITIQTEVRGGLHVHVFESTSTCI